MQSRGIHANMIREQASTSIWDLDLMKQIHTQVEIKQNLKNISENLERTANQGH